MLVKLGQACLDLNGILSATFNYHHAPISYAVLVELYESISGCGACPEDKALDEFMCVLCGWHVLFYSSLNNDTILVSAEPSMLNNAAPMHLVSTPNTVR